LLYRRAGAAGGPVVNNESMCMRLSQGLPAVMAALLTVVFAGDAAAQQPAPESWPAVKCQRYKKAYADAIAKFGKRGLGPAFLESHDAFLASDCTVKVDVCPRSKEELDLANVLVILSMNQGMASTFVPFNCRK